MSLWTKLFSSDKLIEGGINAADKMFHTAEEQSDAKRAFLKLYEPFKLAQRYLALITCVPYAFSWMVAFFASFFVNIDKQLTILQGDMSNIVFVIVSFYFLGGASEGVVRLVTERRK